MKGDRPMAEVKRFKDLTYDEVFEFKSRLDHPEWGLCSGPWRRVSPRKYRSIDDRLHYGRNGEKVMKPLVCTLSGVSCEVVTQ